MGRPLIFTLYCGFTGLAALTPESTGADLKDRTGRRLGLDKVASATLGTGKIALGADALVWWREYKSTRNHEPLLKIARYCAYDVKVTKCIHEYGAAHGHVKFDDGSGTPQVVPVHW